jgi:hypothetical protein
MRFINPLLLCLVLSSCSPKHENNILPDYSDMGAAEDAGKAK